MEKSPEEFFAEARHKLADMIWEHIETLNRAKGVHCCGFERTLDLPSVTDSFKGQVLTLSQSYQGARITLTVEGKGIESKEIDPDRTIQIQIGATEDWASVVLLMSSLHDRPIQIVNGSEGALREAIEALHGEIFQGWPLSRHEVDRLVQRYMSGEG